MSRSNLREEGKSILFADILVGDFIEAAHMIGIHDDVEEIRRGTVTMKNREMAALGRGVSVGIASGNRWSFVLVKAAPEPKTAGQILYETIHACPEVLWSLMDRDTRDRYDILAAKFLAALERENGDV